VIPCSLLATRWPIVADSYTSLELERAMRCGCRGLAVLPAEASLAGRRMPLPISTELRQQLYVDELVGAQEIKSGRKDLSG